MYIMYTPERHHDERKAERMDDKRRRQQNRPPGRRQYTDDELKILADVFGIDTGGTFHQTTDEEATKKAEKIFPKAQRDEVAQRVCNARGKNHAAGFIESVG